jgi:hypothetical protein
MSDEDAARDCERYGTHEWQWLTRHRDPGSPRDVVLANVICIHCGALGFEEIGTDEDA